MQARSSQAGSQQAGSLQAGSLQAGSLQAGSGRIHNAEPAARPYRQEPIARRQCEELLGGHRVGRVSWQSSRGQHILPVSYAWHDGAIVFRTSPYGLLAELGRPREVAFEVDDVDPAQRTGWSVLVTGRAAEVAAAEDIMRLWESEGPVPWVEGVRNLFIRITPQAISGRRIMADL